MKAITSPPRTLVIAAHPDDEILGAGGFLARYPGCEVAIVSDGTMNELDVRNEERTWTEYLAAKRAALKLVASYVGFSVTRIGDFPDQEIQFTRPLQEWIESVIREVRPEIVLSHSPKELNRDHQVVAEAVRVACRPTTESGQSLNMLLAFHVDPMGLGDWQPNLYVPLTEDELTRKLNALNYYEKVGAIKDWPHPRSIRAVEMQTRYYGSRLGTSAADAYELIWSVL